MSQADFTIANQTFPNTRAEINTSLQALATNSAGNSAPSTTFANQWWFDSDGDQLYIRNKDNDAWVKVFKIGATSDLITELATDSITIAGSTPTLTIGDGGAEDTKILFDGNAQNFYIGLDDSADDLLIGLGSTVGTTPAIAINENNLVTLPDGHMVIASTAAGDNLTLKSTNAGAEAGPQLVLHRDSASPANNDVIGRMRFEGEDNEGNKTVYAQLTSQIIDKGSSGGEDSTFQMEVFNNGALRDIFKVAGATNGLPEIVFNDASQDVNFRIEADGSEAMFFLDGGQNRIGIGTYSPGRTFTVSGDGIIGLEGSTNAVVFTESSTLRGYITSGSFGDHNGDGLGFVTSTGEPMKFFLNTSQKVTFQSNGTVKIGSNPADNGQLFVQHQNGNTGTYGVQHQSPTSNDDTSHFLAKSTRAGSSAYRFFQGQSNNGGDDEVIIRGDGNAYIDGSWNGGGADYAEYFEWKDGNSSSENRIGYSVVLDGNKIVKATDSDDISKIIGVISANPAIVGDTDIGRWKQKYLLDDYNNFIMEDKKTYEWRETIETEDNNGFVTKEEKIHSYYKGNIPDGITVPNDAEENTQSIKKLNPDWNKDTTYVSREERKEWDTVGLMGKLRLKKGQPTGTNWIKMRDISSDVEEWLVR